MSNQTGDTYSDTVDALKLLSGDLSGESKKTGLAIIKNFDELVEKKNNNDMKGVYEKVETSLKLTKKIVPEIENNKMSKSISQFIPAKESLLKALKPLMEKMDSESFFKTLEPALAQIAAGLKQIHADNAKN